MSPRRRALVKPVQSIPNYNVAHSSIGEAVGARAELTNWGARKMKHLNVVSREKSVQRAAIEPVLLAARVPVKKVPKV